MLTFKLKNLINHMTRNPHGNLTHFFFLHSTDTTLLCLERLVGHPHGTLHVLEVKLRVTILDVLLAHSFIFVALRKLAVVLTCNNGYFLYITLRVNLNDNLCTYM